jgi:hypothetical protein
LTVRSSEEPGSWSSRATSGQLQKKTPPIVVSPSAKSAKMPVDGEM